MRRLRAESLQISGYLILVPRLTVLEDDQGVGLKAAFGLGQAEAGVGQQAVLGPPVTARNHFNHTAEILVLLLVLNSASKSTSFYSYEKNANPPRP